MSFTRSGLIPRMSLPFTKREVVVGVKDENNPFDNDTTSYSFTRATLTQCTVQRPTLEKLELLPSGTDTENAFTIFTDTPMFTAIPKTTLLADAVYIPACLIGGDGAPEQLGGFFVVTSVANRTSGVINHTEAIVVRDLDEIDNEGNEQYPDVTNLLPNVDTKSKLLAGSFITDWLAEN